MPKHYSELTEEQKEKKRASCRIRSKRRKAERAIAAGRTPGVVGGPRKLTDEQRIEHRKATFKKYREKDPDALRAYDAAWKREQRRKKAASEGREVGPKGKRRFILAPEERVKRTAASAKKSRLKHAGKHAKRSREYYLSHREEWNARARARAALLKQTNPEKYRAQTATAGRNRRARRKESTGKHKTADIEFLWTSQRGHCVLCLKPLVRGKFHVDHHIPLARGGSNDRSNLRLLHKKCNLEKSSRDPYEHAKDHGMLCW